MSENRCPRCKAALAMHGESELCSNGCGEWFDSSVLTGQLDDTWGKAGPCPRCDAAMTYLTLGKITAQRCADHGVFVASTDRAAFIEKFRKERQLADDLEQRQAAWDAHVDQVMKAIADPRELARRIVMLEHQVAMLLANR